jgi:hypothetical protein
MSGEPERGIRHHRARGPPRAAQMTGSRRDAEFMTEKQS